MASRQDSGKDIQGINHKRMRLLCTGGSRGQDVQYYCMYTVGTDLGISWRSAPDVCEYVAVLCMYCGVSRVPLVGEKMSCGE